MRSAAAQLAFPCLGSGSTALDVHAVVSEGGRLVWRPEPLVAAAGCRHRSTAALTLDEASSALWLDELVLGRSSESPSDCDVTTTLRIDRGDRPVLRDGIRTAPTSATGPAVLAGARYLVSIVDVGAGALGDGDALGSRPLAHAGRLARLAEPTSVGRERLLAGLDAMLSPR